MKKARIVEIPEDRPLTEDEYEKLSKHAFNSSVWTLGRSRKSEREIRDKLQQKGYVAHDVLVKKEDVSLDDARPATYSVNIIDDLIEQLKSLQYIDDEYTAQMIAESELRRGKGPVAIKMKLQQKGFTQDIINETLEEHTVEDDVAEAIQRAADAYTRKSVYRKEANSFMKKQKLMKHLATRGFSFPDINQYFDDVYDYLEVD